MKRFFCKLFAPWAAEDFFDDLNDYFAFLLRRNRVLNAVRVVLFLIAAVCLILGYAFEPQPYNSAAVGALILALGLSLVIIQNEKQLPREYQKDT